MRYLPLHYYAEQLERIFANRMFMPHCPDLKKEQWDTWRRLVREYHFMIQDVVKTTSTRTVAACGSETQHLQVLHSNSTKLLR